MKTEIKFIEIISELAKLDRTQASNVTKMSCQLLMDYLKSYVPSSCCRLLEFSAKPGIHHLGFSAPSPWELVTGSICFSAPGKAAFTLDHAVRPMLIATHSHAFVGDLPVCTQADPAPAGKLVLLTATREQFSAQLTAAIQGNAYGIASCAFSRFIGQNQARGRIELPSLSPVFGLSLTQSEHNDLASMLSAGALSATVSIVTEQSGNVPVLEIRTHPDADKEILLCAHICHLRPGANDNASGVAVLCELLRCYSDSLPPVRLIFAPEFTGMSAYLATTGVKPIFAINVDMVGGDPALTGAQLELECSPPYLRHPLQDLLTELFQTAHDLDGRVTAFKGYSDHALFACKAVAVPAVLIGQSGDVFNHTDLDRLDNLSLDQMENVCRLLARFLSKAGPYYELLDSQPTSEQVKNTLPFNIYNLLNACDTEMAADIRLRLSSDKGTYARLQRAWLATQWHQESLGDTWAEKVIGSLNQTRLQGK